MSDDDNELFGSRAFQIRDTGEDFDLNIPPTSGLEYLQRVQREAKKCPSVVVADIDTSTYSDKQTFKVLSTSGLHPAPHGFSPSLQWQREETTKFSCVRQYISRYKKYLKKNNIQKANLPSKDDVTGWCQLCFGQLRATGGLTSVFNEEEVSELDVSNTSTDSVKLEGPASNRGTPPLLSIVGRMDQATIIQVLEYHINWFEATGITENQGHWFYALLACLEKPMDPEVCALLRNLARDCANLRASLESGTDVRLPPLNLTICLVARYFDQGDLADVR